MTMPVLILVGLVAAGCGQEECVPWIEEGGEYQVTLGPVTTEQFGSLTNPPSCGTGFDLEPGDTLSMVEVGENFHGNPDGCTFHDADVSGIPNVVLHERQPGARFADYFLAIERHVAIVREECEGSYQVGLIVEGPYDSDPPYAGNIIVFRDFFSVEVEPCLVPGSELEGSERGCADAWYAQVENERGEVVAEFP
jgi:hypothetical protein